MRNILIFIGLLCFQTAFGQVSQNGKLRAAYKSGTGLVLSYKDGSKWVDIMSMKTDYSVIKKTTKGTVSYEMKVGKRSHCTNRYVEAEYAKAGNSADIQRIRIYDDGFAITSDAVASCCFATSKNNWILQWSDSYEGFFPKNRELKTGSRYAFPALFEYENGVFALLSESRMTSDMAATSMYPTSDKLTFELRPDGTRGGDITLIVGKLEDIVGSTLIADNSEACKLADNEWVKPGVAAWVYWAYNHGSNDYNIIKKYTDMAVELGLPYVLIDAEWDEMKDGYTIEDAVKYATERNVSPIIWYSSSIGWTNGAPGPKYRLNTPKDREREFAWCERIGVKGVKIDFFSGDTNENIKFMIDLMESAAKHHLLVNFHGATIPRGWQRTYPNLISVEAVYGAEWYNNVPYFTDKAASHNAMLPFTRNVIGSMDYTPCAFTDSQHPHITTHAHELALTALFESGIQHLADRPESFLAQPQQVRKYLGTLPAAWDETRLLSGYPGESVVIARRKGNAWYVAGINGTDADKALDISKIASLNIKNGTMTLFEDGASKDNPWTITERSITSKTIPTSIKCQPRGGFVMVLTK